MKRWYVGRSFFIYSIAFCVTVFVFCWLMRGWLYTLGDYRIHLDPLVSSCVAQEVAAAVHIHRWYDPKLIAADIQKKIPNAQTITVANKPLNRLEIEVVVQQPLYRVNHDFIITDKNTVVPASWYAQDLLKQLPCFTLAVVDVDGVPIIDYSVLFALAHLPASVWNSHQIRWINTVDAYLYDNKQKEFTIRFNAQALPNAELLAMCAQLKDQIFGDKKFFLTGQTSNNDPNRIIVADIRFANQIIVYEHKRGIEEWVNC